MNEPEAIKVDPRAEMWQRLVDQVNAGVIMPKPDDDLGPLASSDLSDAIAYVFVSGELRPIHRRTR